ncbi:response regulator [Ruminiclostridium cellobioparum]|jgi:two-component system response regulator YesN|uniref:response regulator n=1 Tax=Ruminiclostridium cellobioparum TaxID=29355 RepID=UPI0028B08E6F|nr:response regulator [Ruminiclostridium cellobioparum]
MKMVIVDDEMLVRAGIKSAIKWEKEGYTIVGEAEDGFSALKVIEETKPDIVLLDVNMPGMNGIDLIKLLREKEISCSIIILSCHEEFEFVKDALKNGARDYLLKHKADPDHILQIVNDAKNSLLNDRRKKGNIEKLQKNAEIGKYYLKNKFLIQLLKGEKLEAWEIEKKVKELNIKISEKNLSCIVFQVDNLDNVKKRYDTDDNDLLQFSIINITTELLSQSKECEFLLYDDNMYIIITSNSNEVSRKNIHDKNIMIINRIYDALQHYLNIYTSFGIGECKAADYSNIALAFSKAKSSLGLKFINFHQHIFSQLDLCNQNDLVNTHEILKKFEIDIQQNIKEKEFVTVVTKIDELVKWIKSIRYNDYYKIILIFEKIIECIAKECNINFTEYTSLTGKCNNIDELRNIVVDAINKINMPEENEVVSNYVVREAITFIKQNYNKDIGLELIAEHIGYSESYLSRVFNKEMNMSILNYLNTVRINKAKELLMDYKLKNYEIADKVGFNTAIHFNIVFKKITGKTPTEYRNNFGNGKVCEGD